MTIARSVEEVTPCIRNGTCLTIGNFDGVHRGHQALVARLLELARRRDLESVVVTFDPHPLRILMGQTPPFITPTEQKLELLDKLGLDFILCLSFDREMAALSPEEFVERYLVHGLLAKHIVIGHDYAFGKNRRGNFQLLSELGKRFGYEVEQIAAVSDGEAPVSSTRIRTLIQAGDVWQARPLLGRFYRVAGTVIEGRRRGGPLLGIPTANLNPTDELIPKPGVYAVWAGLEDGLRPAVANVGYNPTFSNGRDMSVEVHILDFDRDIYGSLLHVHFVQRLRDETKFSGVQELLAQIRRDIEEARSLLGRSGAGPGTS